MFQEAVGVAGAFALQEIAAVVLGSHPTVEPDAGEEPHVASLAVAFGVVGDFCAFHEPAGEAGLLQLAGLDVVGVVFQLLVAVAVRVGEEGVLFQEPASEEVLFPLLAFIDAEVAVEPYSAVGLGATGDVGAFQAPADEAGALQLLVAAGLGVFQDAAPLEVVGFGDVGMFHEFDEGDLSPGAFVVLEFQELELLGAVEEEFQFPLAVAAGAGVEFQLDAEGAAAPQLLLFVGAVPQDEEEPLDFSDVLSLALSLPDFEFQLLVVAEGALLASGE